MKNLAKKAAYLVSGTGLLVLNYHTFSDYFSFFNGLLFFALAAVATAVQLLMFIVLQDLLKARKEKPIGCPSLIITRLFAKGLDLMTSLFILLLSSIIFLLLPYNASSYLSVLASALYFLFCDSVTMKGSFGKRVFGLQVVKSSAPETRCPIYASAVRNSYTLVWVFSAVALSGEELRHSTALSGLFLTVFIVGIVDIIYLKKSGERFLDKKLGLEVRDGRSKP